MDEVRAAIAFSSEVDPGSRQENASKQKPAPGSDAIRTEQALAGGVPTLGKWNQRPGSPVVIGGTRRQIAGLGLGQEIILRYGRDGRIHSIQQQIEFNVTHRALRVRSTRSQNGFVPRLNGSFEFYRSANRRKHSY
jgi:hypothetical protein